MGDTKREPFKKGRKKEKKKTTPKTLGSKSPSSQKKTPSNTLVCGGTFTLDLITYSCSLLFFVAYQMRTRKIQVTFIWKLHIHY